MRKKILVSTFILVIALFVGYNITYANDVSLLGYSYDDDYDYDEDEDEEDYEDDYDEEYDGPLYHEIAIKRIIKVSSATQLQNALNNAVTGDKILLVNYVSTNSTVTLNKNVQVVLDLNNMAYTYNAKGNAIVVKAGKLSIKNANIKSKKCVVNIGKNASGELVNGSFEGQIVNHGTLNIYDGSFTRKAFSGKKNSTIDNYGILVVTKGYFSNAYEQTVYNNKKLRTFGGTFTCTKKGDESMAYPAICNGKKGDMYLCDTKVIGKTTAIFNNGKIEIDGCYTSSSKVAAVYNNKTGKMTVYCGKHKISNHKYPAIYNEGKAKLCGSDYAFDYDTHALGMVYNYKGTLTVERGFGIKSSLGVCNDANGRVSLKSARVSASRCAVFNVKGSITISGGNYCTKSGNTVINAREGTLNVKGGTIFCTGYYYAISNYGNASIKNGIINNKGSYYICNNGGNLQVSGGKAFSKRVRW